jgi:hypothetical protein
MRNKVSIGDRMDFVKGLPRDLSAFRAKPALFRPDAVPIHF